jgi:hypothetical protein
LIAELVAGEIARAAGLPVPEIVLMELDAELARTEPDPEIQELIKASTGVNVALDYLPGSVMFDAITESPRSELASLIVCFDAFVTNVDRTPRNTNMLMWHRELQLIDHGAALYFHHAWSADYLDRSQDRFALIKDHVLLPFAASLSAADEQFSSRITPAVIRDIVALIPDSWLLIDTDFKTVHAHRDGYVNYLQRRLAAPHAFVEEAMRARTLLV